MSIEELQKQLLENKKNIEEKISNLGFPIPNKADLKELCLPDNLSIITDLDLDGYYDKFTKILQFSHYYESELELQIDMIIYNRDLLLDITLTKIGSWGKKNLLKAEAIKTEPKIKEWEQMLMNVKSTHILLKGLIKGYKNALKRIESEKIERASKRKYGG